MSRLGGCLAWGGGTLPREAPEQQPAEDRRQNQTTVARTRRPLPEPDDRRQN